MMGNLTFFQLEKSIEKISVNQNPDKKITEIKAYPEVFCCGFDLFVFFVFQIIFFIKVYINLRLPFFGML